MKTRHLTGPASQVGRTPATATVIVNGLASATGVGGEVLADALAQLRRTGVEAQGHVTCTESELHRVLEGEPAERVILFGGDGTLHAAVNAPGRLPELALVPAGRANNVARTLGIPLEPQEALNLAASAAALPVDLLRVETDESTRYAVEAVSAGLQADARARYTGRNSGDFGAGLKALAAAIAAYRPYRTGLRLDEEPVVPVETAQIFISNMPYFGFGFRVNPNGDPSDGRLEAIVMRAQTRRQALSLLVASHRGTHLGRDGVSMRRVRKAALTEPLPLVVDGTPLGVTRASVSVEPARLKLVSAWRH